MWRKAIFLALIGLMVLTLFGCERGASNAKYSWNSYGWRRDIYGDEYGRWGDWGPNEYGPSSFYMYYPAHPR